MAADVAIKAKTAENVNQGTAIVFVTQGGNVTEHTDRVKQGDIDKLFNKYKDRFDDPTYYG